MSKHAGKTLDSMFTPPAASRPAASRTGTKGARGKGKADPVQKSAQGKGPGRPPKERTEAEEKITVVVLSRHVAHLDKLIAEYRALGVRTDRSTLIRRLIEDSIVK